MVLVAPTPVQAQSILMNRKYLVQAQSNPMVAQVDQTQVLAPVQVPAQVQSIPVNRKDLVHAWSKLLVAQVVLLQVPVLVLAPVLAQRTPLGRFQEIKALRMFIERTPQM